VEFVGIAASGKSSISDAFVNLLKRQGYDVCVPSTRTFLPSGKIKKYLHPLRNAIGSKKSLRSLFFTIFYFFLLFPVTKAEFKNYYLLLISFICKNYCIGKKSAKILVFGGEVCILVNLPISRLSDKSLNLFIDNLYIHDAHHVFVFVETPLDTAIQRAHKDNKIKPEQRPEAFILNPQKRESIYKRNIENQKRIMDILGSKGNDFLTIEVDGTSQPEGNANKISEVIQNKQSLFPSASRTKIKDFLKNKIA